MRTLQYEITLTNLAAEAKQAGVSQAEICRRTNIPQGMMHRLMSKGVTGRTSYGTVMALCDALGVEPSRILEAE